MTENKAIERIKYRMHTVEQVAGENGMEDLEMAIKALEEVQQYRAIGTVEECRAAVEQLENERKFWKHAYDKDLGKEKARSYAHASEIVKGGGVDAKTDS